MSQTLRRKRNLYALRVEHLRFQVCHFIFSPLTIRFVRFASFVLWSLSVELQRDFVRPASVRCRSASVFVRRMPAARGDCFPFSAAPSEENAFSSVRRTRTHGSAARMTANRWLSQAAAADWLLPFRWRNISLEICFNFAIKNELPIFSALRRVFHS